MYVRESYQLEMAYVVVRVGPSARNSGYGRGAATSSGRTRRPSRTRPPRTAASGLALSSAEERETLPEGGPPEEGTRSWGDVLCVSPAAGGAQEDGFRREDPRKKARGVGEMCCASPQRLAVPSKIIYETRVWPAVGSERCLAASREAPPPKGIGRAPEGGGRIHLGGST